MNDEDNNYVKGKKVECIIGLFFLIPPILGVVAFVINLLGGDGGFAEMYNLSDNWTCDWSSDGGGGMSAAPIFLGLMAMVGAYLIKGNINSLFKKDN